MNIAHVVSTYPPYKGGIGNVCYQLSRHLSVHGRTVTVFTPQNKGNSSTGQDSRVVRLHPWLAIGNAAFVPQVLWRLWRFDVIHVHYPFLGAEMLWLIKIFRPVKIVLQYQMDLVGAGPRKTLFSLYNQTILRVLLRFSDLILFSSRDYYENSLAKKMVDVNKTDVLANGVDADVFHCTMPRQESGPGRRETNVLFVGGLDRAHYFKGLHNLLKAMAGLDGVMLTVVGSGDLQEQYQQDARHLRVDEKVNFAGSVDDEKLVTYYCQTDILILPSIDATEAYGLVLLEAMACGRAVIASTLPGVRSLISDGRDGLLVRPGEVDQLRQAITQLSNDPKRRTSFGLAGQRKVRAEYSWAGICSILDQKYRSLYTPKDT